MKLLGYTVNKLPSVINDPFKKTKITRIYVSVSERWPKGSNKWSANGSIEFTNGDTKGEQSFDGDTFDDVVLKIKNCIENL